jgi:uncharacterized membrane protein
VLNPALPDARLSWRAALLLLLATLLLSAYLLAGHIATTTAPVWAPYLALAPLILMVASTLAGQFGLVAGVVAGLGQLALTVQWQDALNAHLDWLYFLQHVGFNAALALLFGLTLRSGHLPLITRMAGLMRGPDMPPAVLAFTRGATLAWTLFFCTIALVSIGLFALADLRHWSIFANLLTTPLVGAMFLAEYAARRHLLRDISHPSLIGNFRSIREAWVRQSQRDEPAP